jgi:cytidylate kinase
LGRERYLRKYFKKDINDPLLYHLVINTDLISFEEVAWMITEAIALKAASSEAAAL